MSIQLLFSAFLAVVAACAIGVAVWALLALRRVRTEAEDWRTRHEALQLELARSGAQVGLVGPLEKERDELRERLEYLGTERSRLETLADRVPVLEGELRAASDELVNQKTSNAALMMRLSEQAQAHQDKVAALTEVNTGIENNLKAMAAQVLQSSQGTFLELANQAFEKHKVGAEADLQARQKAVENLLTPLQETLTAYRQQTSELERVRAEAYGALSGELRSVAETQNAVRTETSRLVQALRASPKTRGRWGEHTLQNVLELSGLTPYCDFLTEETFERREERVRPDVVIRLPGGRSLVVDAKTSTTAYLDAVEAVTDDEREKHLVLHAAQTREHMKKLASKSYWDGLTETPDFVVMFIPGENFYSAAVERDPALFEDAVSHRVIIVTPSTLIALAKAVAFGWRQEKVAETARQVHELGRELYRRITVMAGHIHACGGSLSKSVKCFNEFIGSLEQSVMPQVRRFNELEVEGAADEIPALKPVELQTRLLRSDRDFAPSLPASANGEAGSPATAA
ncbi:MAG: DNA recombination protein RmuC [Proteobacteria bacterium]|nr:DNA recombination protein RmuC [Pseudomonadota bacterium]